MYIYVYLLLFVADQVVKINVQVPQGYQPGQLLTVRTPSGKLVKALPPKNIKPGERFHVNVKVPLASTKPVITVPSKIRVKIPIGVVPGQKLQIATRNGGKLTVTVAESHQPGDIVYIDPSTGTVLSAANKSLHKKEETPSLGVESGRKESPHIFFESEKEAKEDIYLISNPMISESTNFSASIEVSIDDEDLGSSAHYTRI